MIIHLSGMQNIDNPGVLAVPRVSVCLDCGFSTFTVPQTGLRVLQEANAKALVKSLSGQMAVRGPSPSSRKTVRGNLPISAVDPESIYSKRDFPGASIFGFVPFERNIWPHRPENEALEGSALQQQAYLEAEIAAAITVAAVEGLCGCGELLKRES
jgi:hypothetical protein